MIDSHCHLADEVFAPDLGAVVDRAKDVGLERVMVILEAGNEREATQARELTRLWPETRLSVGVHPHAAHQFAASGSQVADLVRTQVHDTPLARAIGEIGLDYHYDYSPRDVQQQVFQAQLDLAHHLSLPIVIHTREADADTVAMLKAHVARLSSERVGVLHCFTGTWELAQAGLDLGFYISLAGIVTFPKAADLREVARRVPLDRLLVETDSPFLAPVPHRGKRNEPAHVAQVVATLADLHGIDAGEMARQTTANFHRLFRP